MCFTVATGANAWKTSIFSASVGLVEKATKPETEQRICVKVGVCFVCVCVFCLFVFVFKWLFWCSEFLFDVSHNRGIKMHRQFLFPSMPLGSGES